MGWILFVSRMALRLGRHGGKVGGVHLPHSGVITPPPAAPGSTFTDNLVIVPVFVILIAAGLVMIVRGVMAARNSRLPPRRKVPAQAAVTPGHRPAGEAARPLLPPVARMTPEAGDTQSRRIAVTLFSVPCDDCKRGVRQPCRLVRGVVAFGIEVGDDESWPCHYSRYKAGVKQNPGLYLDLMANWVGEVPEWVKGLKDVGRKHRA